MFMNCHLLMRNIHRTAIAIYLLEIFQNMDSLFCIDAKDTYEAQYVLRIFVISLK